MGMLNTTTENKNARILIVEDEKIIALDLQRRLEKYGYQIVGMHNSGKDAIEAVAKEMPDIVLMDVMLNGEMDGIHTATHIYTEFQVPIIFLTAYTDQHTLERAKSAEPFGYVVKPFKERELYSTINIALYKSNMEKTLKRHDRWLSTVLHNIGDGIITTNDSGIVEYINPVAQSLTGHKDISNAKHLSEIFPLYDAKTGLPVPIPTPESIPIDDPMFFEDLRLVNSIGAQIHIEGSFAGLYDKNKKCEGLVVAFQDVTTIKAMSDTIMYQASHDSLTGLINRDEFFLQLQKLIQQGSDKKLNHFLYLDIDQFKVVNDLCGHLAGDELLRQIAHDIQGILPEDSAFARLGGDEFGILLKNLHTEKIEEYCRDIILTVDRKFSWKQHAIHISVSIGVVHIDGTMDPYSVLAAADDATYLAKEAGGSSFRIYLNADFSFLKRRGEMQWVSRLTDALEENRFILFEQPIVATSDKQLVKHEILLRMCNENKEKVPDSPELISPIMFIPAAERYNLMPEIDRWVIHNTFTFIAESKTDRKFSINLSGASIADDTLSDFICAQFKEFGINPENICFEITETTAIENLGRAISFIEHMRDLGASFALDDFGSGFSSFNYLKNLPVQYLKLDGSYVKDILTDPVSMQLVKSINEIGHVLGMKTIAEFVRSSELITSLKSIGVDLLQGFEIQKPAPLSNIHNPK